VFYSAGGDFAGAAPYFRLRIGINPKAHRTLNRFCFFSEKKNPLWAIRARRLRVADYRLSIPESEIRNHKWVARPALVNVLLQKEPKSEEKW